MKQVVLIIAIAVFATSATSQTLKKGDDGLYYSSYIHNFYNRTSDVVMKVAKDFLKGREEVIADITNDKEMQTLKTQIKLEYEGYRNACITSMDVIADVFIHYKDGRTKIEITNFKYKNAETQCDKSGTLEDLVNSKCCKNYNVMLKDIQGWTYYFSQEYKSFLAKKSRDPNLY